MLSIRRLHTPDRSVAATVALDLRTPGQVGAVAVDRQGRARAWVLVIGGGRLAALVQRAVQELALRPRRLRILLGAERAQVATYDEAETPEREGILDVLRVEGYEPLPKPAVVAWPMGREGGWVAACDEEALASEIEELAGSWPVPLEVTVDQLLLATWLGPVDAAVEVQERTASIVVRGGSGQLLGRSIPGAVGLDEVARETRCTLERTGAGRVRCAGRGREDLASRLVGVAGVSLEPLPRSRGEDLPEELELAAELAGADDLPAFQGPWLDRRSRSLRWARRTLAAAAGIAVVGLILFVVALVGLFTVEPPGEETRAEAESLESQMIRLARTAELAGQVRELRDELEGTTLPWPPVAELLADLARGESRHIGWEQLSVSQGELEIEVSTGEAPPGRGVADTRSLLESSPRIVNVSWEEQVFRGKIRPPAPEIPGVPEAAPGGGP